MPSRLGTRRYSHRLRLIVLFCPYISFAFCTLFVLSNYLTPFFLVLHYVFLLWGFNKMRCGLETRNWWDAEIQAVCLSTRSHKHRQQRKRRKGSRGQKSKQVCVAYSCGKWLLCTLCLCSYSRRCSKTENTCHRAHKSWANT